ncbi:MAG: transcriptional repressor NrdR [Ruminococcaceae bacterium]|nr:transcriptional repressor NrdR [Oscillospiraceae bacterium]
MRCPICSHDDSKVIDSRPTESGTIRRRRECRSCKYRFTTYEVIEVIPLLVVKKNGSKEIFDRQKLLGGLIKSCYKRPITVPQLEELVDNIEQELYNSLRGEVSSTEIGEMVMTRLKALDEVSYVRFASVYREFKDIETFLSEIRQLQKKTK